MTKCQIRVEEVKSLYRKYHTDQPLINSTFKTVYFYATYDENNTLISLDCVEASSKEDKKTTIHKKVVSLDGIFKEVRSVHSENCKKKHLFMKAIFDATFCENQDTQYHNLNKAERLVAQIFAKIKGITEISISRYQMAVQLANEFFNWEAIEPFIKGGIKSVNNGIVPLQDISRTIADKRKVPTRGPGEEDV